MSTCEKCWEDAQGPVGDAVQRYDQLVKSRTCTPEEQAGPDAKECPECGRKTLHQYTGEAMCGCRPGRKIESQLALMKRKVMLGNPPREWVEETCVPIPPGHSKS